jgi:hypothetical protein
VGAVDEVLEAVYNLLSTSENCIGLLLLHSFVDSGEHGGQIASTLTVRKGEKLLWSWQMSDEGSGRQDLQVGLRHHGICCEAIVRL